MRVLDYFHVRGRGDVSIVDDAPADIKCGDYVFQDGWLWEVRGVDRFAVIRPQDKVGLLLRPMVTTAPLVPSLGAIQRLSAEDWRLFVADLRDKFEIEGDEVYEALKTLDVLPKR